MNKELNLGKDKISKLLIAFSIPCIISMLINSVYNIVDQVFIGQGVGLLGNAATNVIFPMVILCNSIALLIGNGCAAGFSLRLGEKNYKEAKKIVGVSLSAVFIASILVEILCQIFLPQLIKMFGCTDNVYDYAITYGRIILVGTPFAIIYTALSAIIRADGSPRYSMICLLSGAIVNIILDPIFIMGFNMGVAGGAWATIIGQVLSFIIAIAYLKRFKNIKIEKSDLKIDKTLFKVLNYGTASFITQMTILALFVTMNNLMTKYGANSKFGADIPLSVYGVISKLNMVYVASVVGMSVGAQPIIGFNYGAGYYDRVKETLKKVMKVGFIVGFIYNLAILIFPKQLISMFGSADNELYLEFAIDFIRTFLLICMINAFEMCSSNLIQSLGNAKKATMVSFTRQIILFIPIAIIMSNIYGLYGVLYAGPIADAIAFIVVIFIFRSEYKKIGKKIVESKALEGNNQNQSKNNNSVIVTIAREYGSGGRYVGKILAEKLGINFYDKDLIELISKESGLSKEFIEENEQKHKNIANNPDYNIDDKLFIEESKVIKEVANKESCVIIGRCADYVLREEKNVVKVFLYSDEKQKIERAVKYYGIDEKNALKEIRQRNKERANHYKYYTNREWKDYNNYDLCINVDTLGVEKTADLIQNYVTNIISIDNYSVK